MGWARWRRGAQGLNPGPRVMGGTASRKGKRASLRLTDVTHGLKMDLL